MSSRFLMLLRCGPSRHSLRRGPDLGHHALHARFDLRQIRGRQLQVDSADCSRDLLGAVWPNDRYSPPYASFAI